MTQELHRPAPVAYSSDEVIRNFTAVLGSYSFIQEMRTLRVGRLQFRRRKKVLREFTALFIALWNLALHKSFPDDAELIFDEFISRLANHCSQSSKNTKLLWQQIQVYQTLLEARKDSDFTEIAAFITGQLETDSTEQLRTKHRLALLIRGAYSIIFDRLI
ncbi:hypothetical protein Dde_0340 [Oleidesulfovibrio alaskensis G20]|jgi:hypothetical protein|uniref:Uncharacterized protein n=1 Tax=Oleidesulfovibrio alaskensis (strain ATCC BAA-1058 / DSM 17464 / G20) TaxID=207559 RepID=Q316K5_OLEA2|nr:hypothetical protein [Oleidesulfovibrio alaskensis]ABB37141.1 hypothetical protein Dde_0340 [Oleidesulfovibrio alaskensis G20]MBG0774152.1 hypothetical protein [Oleidesulfovibrio alaskensis]MBL3582944.1 hypothetical protein [Oleidesulfovibrio alaskensis]